MRRVTVTLYVPARRYLTMRKFFDFGRDQKPTRFVYTVAMMKPALIIALMIAATPALAEETLQSQASKVVKKNKEDSFLTLNLENDLYGGGTDRNYTNGVRLTYFDMGAELPSFVHALDRIVPTFSINDTTSISYSVGQNLFTPKDIRSVTQPQGDRPWAAFLYTSAALSTITDNHIDSIEATVGVVGPLALGEQVQKFVHKNISDSPRPMGWDNQLDNEPGLMLSWERSFPDRANFRTLGMTGAAVPHVGATIGNIYTYANAGVSFRLSPYEGRWQDDPIRVRPSMPGTGAFIVDDDKFSWYLFGGLEGRAVARNIFLDGNTFSDSYSVDKLPFVADVNGGVALAYGRYRVSYTMVYRTKEFRTAAANGDVFGSIALSYRF